MLGSTHLLYPGRAKIVPELNISKVKSIRVWDHSPNGGTWALPGLSHRGIIPTLWTILFQLENDWLEEAGKYVYMGNLEDDLSRTTFLLEALEALRPRYIQCLFSYINFFFLLENGFGVLYAELRQLARQLNLPLKLGKKPKREEYIEKLRRVRNHTVVHWGGPDKKHDLNSRAGRMWGFAWSNTATDLKEIEFGFLSVVGSEDRILKSIAETHRVCVAYLQQYDPLCFDLLTRIIAHLPITVGTQTYEAVKV
jgi:hypothetical protein